MKKLTKKQKVRYGLMTLLVFAMSAFAAQDLLAEPGLSNSFHRATIIDYNGIEINKDHPRYHQVAENGGISVAVQDSNALVAFFNAMDGPNWIDNSGWLEELVEFWVGISEVTEVEPDVWRVTGITLPRDNQVTPGVIPPEFADLTELRSFSVRGAILPEGVPVHVAVPELRSIAITHSRLTGELPWEAFRDNSPNLRGMQFNQNRLTGSLPAWLGELDENGEIKYLPDLIDGIRIDENRFSGPIPPGFANYPFANVNLDWNLFTGEMPDLSVGPMPQTLQNLRFSQNDFEPGPIPEWLKDMEELRMFNLANTNRTGVIPEWIADMPNLTNIDDLGGVDEIGGDYPESMRFMTGMTQIRLSGGEWTGPMPEFFVDWPSLRRIRFNNMQHDGPLPDSYSQMGACDRFHIRDMPYVTGGIPDVYQTMDIDRFELMNMPSMDVGPFPEWIGTAWSGMSWLMVRGVGLTGDLPASFENLNNLQTIRLSDNPGLTGDVPNVIQTNTTAGTLDLSNTGLNIDEIPQWYTLNPARSHIGLDGYGIEGPIPGWLVNRIEFQQRVGTLSLADNNLSGPIPVGFGDWKNLDSLNLANNNLEGELPADFGQIGLLRPGVSTLSKLTLSCNEGLTGPFPMEFTEIDDMVVVEFDGTNICEPDDPAFQEWLDGIPEFANSFFPPRYYSVKTSGIKCSELETSSEPVEVVKRLHLYQNYPNPFNPATKIKYDLPVDMHVTLSVYNVLGQLVTALVDEQQVAGTHEISFDATRLASGTYFYRLQADDRVLTQTMMLLK